MATAQQCKRKDTARVKHSAHGAKRDTKLKCRTVVLEVLSRLPRRGGRPQLTLLWQSIADQAEKKHADIFCRAREGGAACERDTGNKNHTVVLKVVPQNNDHTQWR